MSAATRATPANEWTERIDPVLDLSHGVRLKLVEYKVQDGCLIIHSGLAVPLGLDSP